MNTRRQFLIAAPIGVLGAAVVRAPGVCVRTKRQALTRMSVLTMCDSGNRHVTMPEPAAASRTSDPLAGGSTWATRSSRARCQARCGAQPRSNASSWYPPAMSCSMLERSISTNGL